MSAGSQKGSCGTENPPLFWRILFAIGGKTTLGNHRDVNEIVGCYEIRREEGPSCVIVVTDRLFKERSNADYENEERRKSDQSQDYRWTTV